MIQVKHLTRRYGELIAVDDISFQIGRGEVVRLLGHNGAGKTTIMKMMTGYLEPTSGTIQVEDLEVGRDTTAIRSQIGYLPENCPLYPEMTVIDYRVDKESETMPDHPADPLSTEGPDETDQGSASREASP